MGVSRDHLDGRAWRRLGHGIYAWAGLPMTPLLTVQAVRLRLPEGAAFAGMTACWLHRLDVPAPDPIEVLVPRPHGLRARGIWISRAHLEPHEIVVRQGLPVTTLARALSDLGRRLPLVESIVLADMALHAGVVTLGQLEGRIAGMAEPKAESVMESKLRMVLVLAGLPRPEAQVSLHDTLGHFLGRVDLFYPDARLALEYDGGTHRERMVDDNRRQNGLINAGIEVLRFTAPDVLGSPDVVVAQVRAARARRTGPRGRLAA